MPKRKTIQQKEIERVTRNALDELGRKIVVTARRASKVGDWSKLSPSQKAKRNIHLRDSGNYAVKPFNTLTVSQNFYGQYNTPKGQKTPTDRKGLKNTPLRNAIAEFYPEAKNVFIKNMIELLKSPVVIKK